MRSHPADRSAVENALDRCDLSALADRRVDALSGGEQRRVALARALAQQARVLLLDEPAAHLDVRHRVALGALVRDLVERERMAVLVAMHDLEEAARVASQVLLMRNGRALCAGPPAQAMTSARLREAFDVDVDVGLHAVSSRAVSATS
jgi:iron complex transport system ATP-binding protein